MLAAQRLPLEFDGVVAGDPAFNLTRIAAPMGFALDSLPEPDVSPQRRELFQTQLAVKAVEDRIMRHLPIRAGDVPRDYASRRRPASRTR